MEACGRTGGQNDMAPANLFLASHRSFNLCALDRTRSLAVPAQATIKLIRYPNLSNVERALTVC